MFIASILPVLFACVNGADVSPLPLAPNATITLPYIGVRKPQSYLNGNVVNNMAAFPTFCVRDSIPLEPSADFSVPYVGLPKTQAVLYENVRLREGNLSDPCKKWHPCYQTLTDREYVIVSVSPNAGKGIIVAYPVDETKLPSAIIVQTKGDTSPDPSIPVGVGVTKWIELDTSNSWSNSMFIWYADRVQKTTISDNIQFDNGSYPSTKKHIYLAPYLFENTKETPSLVLTGQIGYGKEEYKLMFSHLRCLVVELDPTYNRNWLPSTIRVAFSGVHHLKPWKILLCILPAFITTAMP